MKTRIGLSMFSILAILLAAPLVQGQTTYPSLASDLQLSLALIQGDANQFEEDFFQQVCIPYDETLFLAMADYYQDDFLDKFGALFHYPVDLLSKLLFTYGKLTSQDGSCIYIQARVP